jgi:hypothetical protein
MLEFLGETFETACLEPLHHRINSSNVPSDFDAADAKTDPNIVTAARSLSAELQQDPTPSEPSADESAAMEKAFEERTRYLSNLETALARANERVERLEKELISTNPTTARP